MFAIQDVVLTGLAISTETFSAADSDREPFVGELRGFKREFKNWWIVRKRRHSGKLKERRLAVNDLANWNITLLVR